MPSRRSHLELGCRIGAFAALGWLLGQSAIPSAPARVDRASESQVGRQLAAWTRAPATAALHGDFAAVPGASTIEWLAALAHSGHVVTWSGSPPAVGVAMEALADRDGGVRVDVAAPRGSVVRLSDDVGPVDSLHIGAAGASTIAPMIVGHIVATTGAQHFTAPARDTSASRAIVVVGSAGWEGKFIVSALEERGWPVIARFAVAPNVDVTQGASLVLDTAHVAAVIAVDSSLQTLGTAIERFVREGGGLILAGTASLAPAVASLAPGTLGARVRPAAEPKDTIGLGSTGFFPVASVRRDAVVLDRRALGVAIAARRVGAGRVMQIGYDDSWRWRMAGAQGSERAHREWWSRIVESVAYVPAPHDTMSSAESAPLAMLVDRLGAPRAVAGGIPHGVLDTRLLVAIMMLFLLTEWASRRMRGLK